MICEKTVLKDSDETCVAIEFRGFTKPFLSEFWVMQEVRKIRSQHLNDRNAIVNGRVKGKINVTRAFGVGYLKQVTSALLRFLLCISVVSSQSSAVGGNSCAQR